MVEMSMASACRRLHVVERGRRLLVSAFLTRQDILDTTYTIEGTSRQVEKNVREESKQLGPEV